MSNATIARRSARRTVHTAIGPLVIVATYDGGPYVDLHWDADDRPAFDVINVHDYSTGITPPFNLSAVLTQWVRNTGARDIAAHYVNN